MKVFFAFAAFYTLFGFIEADVIVIGDITNYNLINGETVSMPADPNGNISKRFTFPSVCLDVKNVILFS